MAILRANEFTRNLPQETLEALVELGYSKRLPKGTFLFLQGDRGDRLFLIVSGEVRITADSSDGELLHLNTFGSGEMLGEIAFLDGGERTVSARAIAETNVFCIDRSGLLGLLSREPRVATEFIDALCRRLRWTTSRFVDHVFLTPEARLCKTLLGLADSASEHDELGRTRIRVSQKELAEFLNTTRQSVNGMLKNLEKEELIELGRGSVVIRRTPELLARSAERLVT